MLLLSLLVQVVLPIGLVCWLAFVPARSLAGYFAQALGTGLLILALTLVALWMLLPWWLPLVYALLWIGAIANRIRRGFRFPSRRPATVRGWIALVGLCALGALGATLSWQAIQGRQIPDVRIVDIPLPLGPGTYLIANGGSREIVNAHMMTLDPTVERFRAYRGQSYGVDLIKIDKLGLRASGLQPRDPAAYDIYGEPVYAPCDGTVIASRDDRPDMPVPVMDREIMEGNHVLLDCGDFVLLLAHFRPGSVGVKAGAVVSIRQHLGVVGNSGNSSEPHLHISAQLPGSKAQPLSGDPLAITIDRRFLVRNDRLRINQ
jgi:hypothetical protein